ncbi:hypothetical protein BYZ73_07895 [Rhodovulum viride]|uniref:Uncharacterized protein n=1 Tax=Rhodovulum viride TaxID=1231134 RepID=A0ABX9DHL4_9RHOB|nr:hypothetical protein BYZ73_07895 [Rhodovulum viride]
MAVYPCRQSILHPNLIGAWGTGADPIMHNMNFNMEGGAKKHGVAFRDLEFPISTGISGDGLSNVIIERCNVRGAIYFRKMDTKGRGARVTIRKSKLVQAFDTNGGLDSANPDFWRGDHRPSCIKPGGGSSGTIIQENIIAWGGMGPGWLNTYGPDGIPSKDDAYGYLPNNSDPRLGLNGYAPPGPNLLTHPIYFDSFNRHILMRDNFVFGSGGSLIQLRGGAVMRNCAFAFGNQMWNVGKGDFNNYNDAMFEAQTTDGHRSLCQDVVATHAGYMDGPNAGNSMSQGVRVSSPLVSFDRVLVLHDLNPNDPNGAARLVSDWDGEVHARRDGFGYTDEQFAPGAYLAGFKGRERDLLSYWGDQVYNPGALDLSNVNDATIFRWYDAQRGNAPDTTTDILDIYWWLRDLPPDEIKSTVDSFMAFMQAPFGIARRWRTAAAACSFVPDLAEDGCRWDNPNNWGRDLIPGSFAGDTLAINGHEVFFQDHTLTVAGLDLGAGGHLHAVNGRLDVAAAPTCTGSGAITVDETGQVWLAGYNGSAPLSVRVLGGRFANTDAFAGPADIVVNSANDRKGRNEPKETCEFLCGHGAAVMTIKAGHVFEIVGGGPRVGFDGLGGAAAGLVVEDGGTLRFTAGGDGRVATLREFRSGANGTAGPDVVSSVTLASGSTLEVDCRSIMVAGTYTLLSVDSLTTTGATLTAINVPSGLSASFPAASGGVQTMVLS